MCTVIPRRKEGKFLIADKDIEVYKGCIKYYNSEVVSIYNSYIYKKDKLNTAEFTYSHVGGCFDDKESDYKDSLMNPSTFIVHGFHSVVKKEIKRLLDENYDDVIICKFIIPTGAQYYKNKVGNVVSNQIIFKEIIS